MHSREAEFILESRHLADFYFGIADVLEDPDDDDFKLLACAFATLKAEANYTLQTALIAHIANLWDHSKDGPEIQHRAFEILILNLAIGKAGMSADQIKALRESLEVTK